MKIHFKYVDSIHRVFSKLGTVLPGACEIQNVRKKKRRKKKEEIFIYVRINCLAILTSIRRFVRCSIILFLPCVMLVMSVVIDIILQGCVRIE